MSLTVPVPACFGYADTGDYSCRKCKVLKECKVEQAATRPDCFGKLYDADSEECKLCIDASVCADQKQITKKEIVMDNRTRNRAKRPRVKVRRRMRKPPVNIDNPTKVKNMGGMVTSRKKPLARSIKDSEYAEWGIPDLREELKARGIIEVGRKSILIQRLLADDSSIEDEKPAEADIAERVPHTAKAIVPKAKQLKLPPVRVIKRLAPLQDISQSAMAGAIKVGQSIVITRVTKDSWSVAIGNVGSGSKVPQVAGNVIAGDSDEVNVAEETKPVVHKGLRGKAWKKEVFSLAYWKFHYEDAGNGKCWADMSDEEKYEFSDNMDITWKEHDNDRINMMRCVGAVYKALEITKYKSMYKNKADRDALR